VKDFLLSQDIIFVSGGHTKSMLMLWNGYGIDAILREAYDNGVILSGGSAGSVCWFDQCITDSIPGTLSVMNCLGILNGSNCPHYASTTRREAYAHFVNSGEIAPGFAADDYAALHFQDGQLIRCVSTRQSAKCYKMQRENNKAVQHKLKTLFLGEKKHQDEFIFNAPCFDYLREPKE